MPKSRFFINRLPDYQKPLSKQDVEKSNAHWHQVITTTAKDILEKVPPTLDYCDGGLYTGNVGSAYMMYHLAGRQAFAAEKTAYLQTAKEYVLASIQYVKSHRCRDPGPSFLVGPAGIFAVGCLVAQALNDPAMLKLCSETFASYANDCMKLRFQKCECDELFVGRAGYLCGIYNLQRKLGLQVIKDEDIAKICSIMIQSGREYAKSHRSKSPLMYSYYGTEYLGAAHGLSSILQMLLCFPHFLCSNPSAEKDVHQSVDFMLSLEQPNGNYSPAMDEVGSQRSESDELVHWCHGAPGVVYLFAKAYNVWGDPKYLAACQRCAELVWQKGLLKKGPGICHGVAGNGYVFLLLYRLTKDEKYLHRAYQFANFMMTEEFLSGARIPDSPYSLYEGRAGTACFLADLMEPAAAEFPFFVVF